MQSHENAMKALTLVLRKMICSQKPENAFSGQVAISGILVFKSFSRIIFKKTAQPSHSHSFSMKTGFAYSKNGSCW